MKKIYIASSTEDKAHVQALENALNLYKAANQVLTWSRLKLMAGDITLSVVSREIFEADTAIVLLSASSFDSRNEKGMDADMLDLQFRADTEKIKLIVVIVSPFAGYQLTSFAKRDLVPFKLSESSWVEIVEKIMGN